MAYASWYDTANMFSKLTVPRILNGLKLLSSYYYSRWRRQSFQWGLPFSISIEPTTSCNLRCPECPSGLRSFTRATGMLKEDFFRTMIDQLKNQLCYLTFYFQGEPYLNPDFLTMVNYAHERKIYTATSTNGHYLTEDVAEETVRSGLDRLIISIDGTSQETYERYRVGGKLEKVLSGARNILTWKKKLNSKTPYVIFQFLVVAANEHEMDAMKKLALALGANELRFKTAQLNEFKNGNELIPEQKKFSRYKKLSDGTYTIKNALFNHCWKMWHSCVVTWDGGVVPCCFDKDASHRLGEMSNHSFEQIWRSDAYRHFRNSVLHSRSKIDICSNCTEGTTVWI
jgi:radical SAM protein with 4Fe4S-binding SPASM domain